MLSRLSGPATQVALRRAYGKVAEGHPGSNIPFALSGNTLAGRVKFTAIMISWIAPPFWFPFFLVKYHLQKNNA